jgi:hypothetical protein
LSPGNHRLVLLLSPLLLQALQLLLQVVPLLPQLPELLLQRHLPVPLALQQQLQPLNAVRCCQLLLLLQSLERCQLNLRIMNLRTAQQWKGCIQQSL